MNREVFQFQKVGEQVKPCQMQTVQTIEHKLSFSSHVSEEFSMVKHIS